MSAVNTTDDSMAESLKYINDLIKDNMAGIITIDYSKLDQNTVDKLQSTIGTVLSARYHDLSVSLNSNINEFVY